MTVASTVLGAGASWNDVRRILGRYDWDIQPDNIMVEPDGGIKLMEAWTTSSD